MGDPDRPDLHAGTLAVHRITTLEAKELCSAERGDMGRGSASGSGRGLEPTFGDLLLAGSVEATPGQLTATVRTSAVA